jgi:hypothetical protein
VKFTRFPILFREIAEKIIPEGRYSAAEVPRFTLTAIGDTREAPEMHPFKE